MTAANPLGDPGDTSPGPGPGVDPGLAPDLADPTLPQATGQGDPAPPATPKAVTDAAALLDQVYWESYGADRSEPIDGTLDPYRS